MRVLYFTVVPLGDDGNGGGMCCRNHVLRLHQDPDIELVVLAAGDEATRQGTSRFLSEIGVVHHVAPLFEGRFHHPANTLKSLLSFVVMAAFQFPWEIRALNQGHVQASLDAMIRDHRIECLVVDYLPSALFVNIDRSDVRTALVTLNREQAFYRDLIDLGHTHHGSLTAGLSIARLGAFERRVHRAVGKVVAIGPPDLPRGRLRSPPVCITPYFDPRPERWRPCASRRCFFVGNIAHYPNRRAVDWLTRTLAPHLAEIAPDVTISIVGADAAALPPEARPTNITFLGRADAETLRSLFLTADLMLCPVENDFGVKFKAVEALAHETPLLASRQTMMGLPHLVGMPEIDLARPDLAAQTIRDLLDTPGALGALQVRQSAQQNAFIASQRGIWARTLQAVPLRDSAT